jgi:hypothetical protein
MQETYLIFTRQPHSHSVVFLIRALSVKEAIGHYIRKQVNDSIVLLEYKSRPGLNTRGDAR